MYHKILPLVMILTLTMTGTIGAAQNAQGFVVRGMGALGCQTLAGGLKGERSADGIYSVQTADAVGKFQKQADIAPTGLPDAWTVFMLQLVK